MAQSETDSFINITASLSKNLEEATRKLNGMNNVAEKVNKSLLKGNDELNETSDVSKKINDTYEKTYKSTKKNSKAAELWGNALTKVKDEIKSTARMFAMGFGAFSLFDSIKETLDLHQSMVDLSYQMGFGGEANSKFQETLVGIQKESGFASDKVGDLMASLIQLRVPSKDIKQLTIDSLRFGDITGANSEAVKNLTAKLTTMGHMGQKDVSDMLAKIVQTQRAFGMSADSVSNLTNSITETTQTLTNMGRSSAFVKNFQSGVIKLAGSFESVGVAASEATQLVDRLLDPGKIEDNALLYSKLGISMEDAINGNIDPEKLQSQMANLGKELKNMGGPQAAALANAMGVNLNTMRSLAEVDMSKTEKSLGAVGDASEYLNDKWEDQATIKRDLTHSWEKLKSSIMGLAVKAMPYLDKFVKFISSGFSEIGATVEKKIMPLLRTAGDFISGLVIKFKDMFSPAKIILGIIGIFSVIKLMMKGMKKEYAQFSPPIPKFENYRETIRDELEAGVSGGLEMGQEKGIKKFKSDWNQKMKDFKTGVGERTEQGTEWKELDIKEKRFRQMAASDLEPWAKRSATAAADYLAELKKGAKPASLLAEMAQKNADSVREKINLNRTAYQDTDNFLTQQQTELEENNSAMLKRLDILKDISRTDLTAKQEAELKILNKQNDSYARQKILIDKEIKDNKSKYKVVDQKLLGKLTKDQLLTEQEITQESLEQVAISRSDLQTKLADNSRQRELLEILNEQQHIQKDLLEEAIQQGHATDEQITEYHKLNGYILETDNSLSRLSEEQSDFNEELEKSNKKSEDLLDKQTRINLELAKKPEETDSSRDIVGKSLGQNFSDVVKSAKSLITAELGGEFSKLIKSFKTVWESIKTNNPVSWLRNIPNRLRKAGDGSILVGALVGFVKNGFKIAKAIGNAGKTVLNGAISALQTAGDGLKRGVKTAAKVGAMALGGMLLKAVAETEAGQRAIQKVKDIMGTMMEKLAPTIETIANMLSDLLDGGLDEVLSMLVELAASLVKVLLPPLLTLLGFLIKGLGSIIKIFGGDEIGTALIDAGDKMMLSAKIMSGSALKLVDSLDQQHLDNKIITDNQVIYNKNNKEVANVFGISTSEFKKMRISSTDIGALDIKKKGILIDTIIQNTKTIAQTTAQAVSDNQGIKAVEALSTVSKTEYGGNLGARDFKGFSGFFSSSQRQINSMLVAAAKNSKRIAWKDLGDKEKNKFINDNTYMTNPTGALTKKQLEDRTRSEYNKNNLEGIRYKKSEGDLNYLREDLTKALAKGDTSAEYFSFKAKHNLGEDVSFELLEKTLAQLTDATEKKGVDLEAFTKAQKDAILESGNFDIEQRNIINKWMDNNKEYVKQFGDGNIAPEEFAKSISNALLRSNEDTTLEKSYRSLLAGADDTIMDKFNLAMIQVKNSTDGKERNDAWLTIEELIRESGLSDDEALAKIVENSKKAAAANLIALEDLTGSITDKEKTPEQENLSSITRKIIPSIIHASSVGFAKTRDQAEVITGLTEEEKQLEELKIQTSVFKEFSTKMEELISLGVEGAKGEYEKAKNSLKEGVLEKAGGTN